MILRLLLLTLLSVLSIRAELRVAPFFGDHMVLQREQPVPVWGRAPAGAEVAVSFREHRATTRADAAGHWRADLPELTVGEAAELRIATEEETRIFTDVLVGDVWLAGGQSNMNWPLSRTNGAEREIAAADFPDIRFLTVERQFSPQPLRDASASWRICTPESAGVFSAVAYFFGRDLHRELNVPIGLVSASRGGSVAEAWMPLDALESYPDILKGVAEITARFEQDPDLENTIQSETAQFEKALQSLADAPPAPDPALFDAESDQTGAETVFPNVSFLEDTDGMVNLRHVFTLSPEQAKADSAVLHLGRIDDFDITWLNGIQIGSTGPEVRMAARRMREYALPEGTLRAGKNVLLIQLIDANRSASFGGGIDTPALIWASGASQPLDGAWEMTPAVDLGPRPEDLDRLTRKSGTFLYNGMIAPLVPAAIRGVIWYQGESNDDRAEEYRRLFPDLIHTWRRIWQQGDFPFYFVQLANFRERAAEPGESNWAALREAQRLSLSVPNTGMAVTIDIGEAGDIHPRNKRDVGKRLARLALGETYGVRFPHPHISPLFREAVREQGGVRIRFDHAEGGLQTTDGATPQSFALAGEDRLFRWAGARIEGEEIVLSHPAIPEPRFVRYAWSHNPAVNLVNAAGLPASPFETDVR